LNQLLATKVFEGAKNFVCRPEIDPKNVGTRKIFGTGPNPTYNSGSSEFLCEFRL